MCESIVFWGNMKKILILLIVLVAAGGGIAWYYRQAGPDQSLNRLAVYTVSPQNMLISVTEGGTLGAVNEITITSELEGNAQIIQLVPEGTIVKKGDLLVELDSSDLQERLSQQQINYQNALSTFTRAEEDLAIQKSQNESNIREAELAVDFARIDLEKYRDGDWPQDRKNAISAITIAEAELKRSQDRLTWTKQLEGQGYATRTEMEADTLTVTRKELELEQAREKLRLLEKYEYPQKLRKLQAEEERKLEEMERVKVRALSSLSQKEADLESKKATLELQDAKLQRLMAQLDKTRIVAPQGGMVVYASSTGNRRYNQAQIVEGATVRQRQELIKLPDTSQMQVEVKVHESRMNQISRGQMAYVVIDAMPDRRFRGRVSKIGLLPDAQSNWMNPDLKVYSTEIIIEEPLPPDVKPGLSARAEIIVQKLEDVLTVPIQSVTSVGDDQVCYLAGVTPTPVVVEIGAYNKSHIHILKGLEAGQVVMLNPPKTEDPTSLQSGVMKESEVTREDAEPRVPPPAETVVAEVTEEKSAAVDDVETRFQQALARMPEERREQVREAWKELSAEARLEMLQRMSQRARGAQRGTGE